MAVSEILRLENEVQRLQAQVIALTSDGKSKANQISVAKTNYAEVVRQRNELASKLEYAQAQLLNVAVSNAPEGRKAKAKKNLEKLMTDTSYDELVDLSKFYTTHNEAKKGEPEQGEPEQGEPDVNDLLVVFMAVLAFVVGMLVMYLWLEFA